MYRHIHTATTTISTTTTNNNNNNNNKGPKAEIHIDLLKTTLKNTKLENGRP